MPTYIDLTNLSPATITALSSTAPTITQVQITTSGYVVKDDTAVSTSGGYIKITGTNFTAGTQVVIGSVTATSVTFVNSTTLNVQVPAQAAGTYIVYVTVSNGGVAILVNGLTYSGDPTWVTGSTLTGGQVDSAISIQFSATGDAPVTYALQAGSTLPPGLSLTSGGLLSGTVTGITSETTYNFTVEAIDGQAQESPRAFSITITASDQFFEYVTTLLSASNPASTFVTDASTNNFAVTVFGDTRPNSFNPYTPGYYSSFNTDTADSGFGVAANAALDMGTGDFTIECWVNTTALPTTNAFQTSAGGYQSIFGTGPNLSATGSQLYIGITNIFFDITTDGGGPISVAHGMVAGSWYHVALTRSGNSFRIFINGVLLQTATSSSSWTGGYAWGIQRAEPVGGYTGAWWRGHISNFRVIKGTALYTAAFTPPSQPLTAISGTVLLTGLSNRFIDTSTNNFTIQFGATSPQISGFDPFAPLSAYSSYGSGYFDGTGDYLTLPSNTAWAFGTGDFTIECWVNPSTQGGHGSSNNDCIIDFRPGSSGAYGTLYIFNNGAGVYWFVSSANRITGGAIPNNAWTHIVVSRVSGNTRLFLNGVQSGSTYADSTNYAQGTPWIAQFNDGTGSGFFNGYITDMRVIKGSGVTSVTVPAAPLTAITNTSLLTLQNNQPNNNNMFLDSSASNFLITRNGNTTQGSFSPYGGGWSSYFDGTGDYLSLSYNAAISIVSGDFTVEMWIYRTAGSAEQYLWSNRSDNPGTGWEWRINSTNLMQFFFTAGSSLTSASTIPVNTWTHLAVTRQTNTVRMFINGTQDATATFSNGTGTSASLFIGWSTSSGGLFQGYMSNARLVKGTAVYTSNFTPSTTPLTPIANTSLLTCADNRFVDDSANNFTVTRNGDVSVQRFNPFNPVLTTPTSYSGYFDGNGDYLTAPASSQFQYTGAYTIEAWVYPLASSGSFHIFGTGSSGQSDQFNIVNGVVGYGTPSNTAVTGPSNVIAFAWNHIAVTRDASNVYRVYVNGVSGTSVTESGTAGRSGTAPYIGVRVDGSNPLTGYISNLRVVNGTAVYSGATSFTPPTIPLTAIANTSLLTCQNATFIDNSTNNFAITVFGNSQPTQFNPFGWTSTTGSAAAYSATNYGGSMYFDGTGDYLVSVLSPVLNLTNGNWTIEAWLYPTSLAAQSAFFGTFNGNSRGLSLMVNTNGTVQSDNNADGASVGTSSGSSVVRIYQWNHVAVTRSGNTISYYINGVASGSSATGTYYDQTTQNFYIGSVLTPAKFWPGYISNLRYVRGTVLYTASFAPPVAPLSFNANTVLQVNGTSAAIYDSSMIATYETVGNAQSTGVIKKYGNSSLYFDGTGDYLVSNAASTDLYAFGTGDFTIEMWAYFNSVASGSLFEFRPASTNGAYPLMYFSSSGVLTYYANTGARINSSSVSTGQWYHIALCRSGTSTKMFLNGVQTGSTYTDSSNYLCRTGGPLIGVTSSLSSDFLNGYLDDLRITKGVARYTSNFTPPTSPVIQF